MLSVDSIMLKNLWNAKFLVGGIFGFSWFWQGQAGHSMIHQSYFGEDGNGGQFLKIITDLTDEEMARLKYTRRLGWHWKGMHHYDQGINEPI